MSLLKSIAYIFIVTHLCWTVLIDILTFGVPVGYPLGFPDNVECFSDGIDKIYGWPGGRLPV